MSKFEALDFLVPCLSFICLGLLIASAATAFAISSFNDTAYGIIFSCSQGKCASAPFVCDTRQDTRNADAAFTIAGCVNMGLAFIISICRLCGNRNFFHNYKAKFVMFSILILLVLTAVFSMVEFILGFILYSVSFCDVKFSSFDTVKIGPHAPLAVAACILSMITAFLEFGFELLARHGSDE